MNQFPQVVFTYKHKVAIIPKVYDMSDEEKTPVPLSSSDWDQACFDLLYYTFTDSEMSEIGSLNKEDYKKCMKYV